jgi:YHS domain-containing protein
MFVSAAGRRAETPQAIDGYCPVCVVATQRLVPGSAAFKTTHEGLEYRFASLRQKSAFLKGPDLYTKDLAKQYASAKGKSSTRREGSGSKKREGSGKRFGR